MTEQQYNYRLYLGLYFILFSFFFFVLLFIFFLSYYNFRAIFKVLFFYFKILLAYKILPTWSSWYPLSGNVACWSRQRSWVQTMNLLWSCFLFVFFFFIYFFSVLFFSVFLSFVFYFFNSYNKWWFLLLFFFVLIHTVSDNSINYMVGSHTKSLLIYSDIMLKWMAKTEFVPVQICTGNFK